MKSLLSIIFLLISHVAFAIDIASCSNPVGKAYFPEIGLVPKSKSGWDQDKVTNGMVKLIKTSEGKYDILFVDATKQITSSTDSGGLVSMLNRGDNVVSFMVVYPKSTAEIYTFLRTTSGGLEYVQVTSRAGDAVMITKASIMRGDCSYINFDNL